MDSIIKKAKKRLYSLSQLKHSGLGTREQFSFSALAFALSRMHVLSSTTVFPRISPMNLRE